jgi:eukaryotic-like serine/threonine-protein kinase
MSLAAGARLGPYEIVGPIGSGGMGEVYRARDTRLSRDVAVKVLPPSFTDDPDRLRRFEQEARAAGMLNHPNLLAVYDIGAHDGAPYVVSELLEGETLRERIGGAPLPTRKAIDYAVQVARGLAAAHDKAIVHRDLKPENIFITRDGRTKILDFGLAKVATPAAAVETVLIGAAPQKTEVGAVLGTAAYMSPEQVRAQPVDHRSDIFSFGLVLYEMLTGRQAFKADSAVETMSAILKADPPRLAEIRHDLPADLERIVVHCLEKNPEERFQSAGDIAFNLESIGGHSSSSGALVSTHAAGRSRWKVPAVTGAAALAIAAAFFAGRAATPPSVEPEFEQLTFRRGSIQAARFAPDARTIVYAAGWEGAPMTLYTAQPGNPESRSLEVQATLLAVSRTGELAILLQPAGRAAVLARMPLGGGAPREILEDVTEARWSPNGDDLAVVHVLDGARRLEYPIGRVLYEPPGFVSSISISPSGDRIAFADHPIIGDNRGDIAVVDASGQRTTLTTGWEDLGQTAWSPDGREIWFSGSRRGTDLSLFAVTLSGQTRHLLTGAGSLNLQDVSPDGRVILSNGGRRLSMIAKAPGATEERDLAWMDYSWPVDISDDGRRLLFSEQGVAGGPGYAVYLRGTDGSPAVRLGKGDAHSLSHDGRWAIANDLSTQTLTLLPTGTGQPRTIPSHGIAAYTWSGFFPGDKRIVFAGAAKDGGTRVYVQDLDGGAPRVITPNGVAPGRNTISPDGKWLAATFGGSVRLFPVDGGEPKTVPGSDRSDEPLRWNADGSVIYMRNGRVPARIVALDVATGKRTLLHELAPRDRVGASGVQEIRLTPDGASYVFGYIQTLHNLYQVTGLR